VRTDIAAIHKDANEAEFAILLPGVPGCASPWMATGEFAVWAAYYFPFHPGQSTLRPTGRAFPTNRLKFGVEILNMPIPLLTKHVPKDELDAFMVYAEENYSTIFDPSKTEESSPVETELDPKPDGEGPLPV